MLYKKRSHTSHNFCRFLAAKKALDDCNSSGLGSKSGVQGEEDFVLGGKPEGGRTARARQRCWSSIWRSEADCLANWNSVCIKEKR